MNLTFVAASLLVGQVDFVKTVDGSSFYGEVGVKTLEVETAYGKLSIPWSDVQSIQFGVRPDAKTHAEIDKLIRSLGSTLFKERDDTTAKLKAIGPLAIGQLLAVSKADAEASQRANKILIDIKQVHKERSLLPEVDVVETSLFTAKGRVVLDEFAFKTDCLGGIKIERQKLASIYRGSGVKTVVIDANDSWHDTGIKATNGVSLNIDAHGQVDLWPQGAGQYMTGPKGYTSQGKGTAFMAGTLVAKIGNTEFSVGESYSGTAPSSGNLMLMIAPSPWNNESTGSYTVNIKIERR